MDRRVKRLRRLMKEWGVDGVIINNINNIRYITGFTGSSGYLIITEKEGYLLTDSRYTTQAKEEVNGFYIKEYKKPLHEIPLLIDRLNISMLGFEGSYLSYDKYELLKDSLPHTIALLSLQDNIDYIRTRKDRSEVRRLEKAAGLSSKALWNVLHMIVEGTKECDIAMEMEYQMKRLGAEKASFDIIVISGERTALPHGRASEREISSGDLIMIDFGCVFEGYSSDETCTLSLGGFSSEQRRVYTIVKEAHDRAIEMVKPGVKASEIDRVARDVIEEAGYGEYFGHGTGHGIGISIHEKPIISPYCEDVIEEDMVFTIEPAIYIPKWGGVRIEDMVLVTRDGCRVLTKVPKDRNILTVLN